MKPTNNLLMQKAADEKAVSDAETSELLVKWGKLNATRAVMVLAGSLLGLSALVLETRR